MPEGKYFLKMGGLLILGLISLAIAAVLFIILLPFILVLSLAALILAGIFVVIWAVVYIALVVGAAIYYLFRPMKVEEKKDYSITKSSESGMRQKGKTRKNK